METVRSPNSCAASEIRSAISPRLAMSNFIFTAVDSSMQKKFLYIRHELVSTYEASSLLSIGRLSVSPMTRRGIIFRSSSLEAINAPSIDAKWHCVVHRTLRDQLAKGHHLVLNQAAIHGTAQQSRRERPPTRPARRQCLRRSHAVSVQVGLASKKSVALNPVADVHRPQ